MSDDFDLLETNSQEKTEKVDVNWGKAIDQMKSKLAQEDDPESRQKILNATLDNVVDMAEKDRTTLLDAIKDLTDYQDEVGIMFEGFSALNAAEQKIIDDAIKRLERSKVELEDANNKPDTWWNNLWGRKGKIKDAEAELKNAQKVRDAADNKAKADITVNKNMVPFDDKSPFVTSGIRIGTAAVTTRGLLEDDMEKIVELIDEVIKNYENEDILEGIAIKVNAMMSNLPLFA